LKPEAEYVLGSGLSVDKFLTFHARKVSSKCNAQPASSQIAVAAAELRRGEEEEENSCRCPSSLLPVLHHPSLF